MNKLFVLAMVCLIGLAACAPTPTEDEGEVTTSAGMAADTPAPASAVDEASVDKHFEEVTRDMILRRDSAMRALIELTEAESEAFWSIKGEYDSRLRELFDEEMVLIAEFAESSENLTREIAADMGRRALDLDRRRVDLHEEYFLRMKSEFSPTVAVQWFQLQTYFEYRAHVRLAQGTPLAMP
jgi:hypothetical protein